MQSEHAHLDAGYSTVFEPHVSLDHNVEQIAHAAVKNIKGGTEQVENYFSTTGIQRELPPKRHINQHLHMGWDSRY